MRAVIDRFEENYAVCELESRQVVNIKKNKMPKEAKEGDTIIIDGEIITIDIDYTKEREAQIKKLADDLWK